MITVYGYSDDNLVLDGAPYPADEIGCFDSVVSVRFSDGTLMFEKTDSDDRWFVCTQENDGKFYLQENLENGEIVELGVFDSMIDAIEKGAAKQTLTECFDEDAEIYSDIFEIDAEYVSHEVKHEWL